MNDAAAICPAGKVLRTAPLIEMEPQSRAKTIKGVAESSGGQLVGFKIKTVLQEIGCFEVYPPSPVEV